MSHFGNWVKYEDYAFYRPSHLYVIFISQDFAVPPSSQGEGTANGWECVSGCANFVCSTSESLSSAK